MGFWDFVKKVGKVVSTPFKAVGNLVSSGAKKVIGSLVEAGKEGGFTGVLKRIGSGILEGAKKVSELPIIQDTPLGRLGGLITKSEGLAKGIEKGDIGEIVKSGKEIAGEFKGMRGRTGGR